MLKRFLGLKKQSRPARIPVGFRVHAVGDIHGRADLLRRVLTAIDNNGVANSTVDFLYVFLGDYVDRGPHSRQVVDNLISFAKNHHCVFLKGNHEAMLLEFLSNPAILEYWRQYGGLQTLLSYGLRPSINPNEREREQLSQDFNRAMPTSHREFFSKLRPAYHCGDIFFVHAGVRPGRPLSRQVEEDLLWIREDFLSYEGRFEKMIVHGHSPVANPETYPNRINIDTGAYATGRLTCAVFQNEFVRFI